MNKLKKFVVMIFGLMAVYLTSFLAGTGIQWVLEKFGDE